MPLLTAVTMVMWSSVICDVRKQQKYENYTGITCLLHIGMNRRKMTNVLWYVVFLGFYCSISDQCDSDDGGYEEHLGTVTPYRVVENLNASEIKYSGCRPQKLWAFIRHGTRNPSAALIDRMTERLPEIRDKIVENLKQSTRQIHNSDLDSFRKWSSKLVASDQKKLSHEGEDEMLLLAERLQSRFPTLMSNVYSNTSYTFKFTATQRTKKSAHHFTAGLFGRQIIRQIDFPEPLKKDPVLRFYKLCQKWRREIGKNPAAMLERRKFDTGPTMKRTIDEINVRLGLQDDPLDLSDVHSMYMTCAFETAWKKRKRSPWCSPFTLDDIKAFEYAEDLKFYWKDGYGYDLTHKQACPALLDLMEFFQDDSPYPKVVSYFTHSGALLKMLAHLDLYKDAAPLTANDFETNVNRRWKVSRIDTFATNLIFVLFDCQGIDKILTLHQERVIRLPPCNETDLCNIDMVVNHYSDAIDECDFDDMCENEQ